MLLCGHLLAHLLIHLLQDCQAILSGTCSKLCCEMTKQDASVLHIAQANHISCIISCTIQAACQMPSQQPAVSMCDWELSTKEEALRVF